MATLQLHGAEIQKVTRAKPPITVGPSSIIGLVGSAPDARVAVAASAEFGAGAAGFKVTADAAGKDGNDITVQVVNPGTNNAALAVDVTDKAIKVSLATSGAGVATTTAASLVAGINANAGAATIVTAAATGGGTGTAAAAPVTNLAGGRNEAFPLNTPVLVAAAAQAADLGTDGSLAQAVADAYRTAGGGGAAIVAVRTADVDTAAALAGTSADKTGAYALLGAESATGQKPRLIAAPGIRDNAVTTALQAVAADLGAVAAVTIEAATAAAAIAAAPDLARVIAAWPKFVVVEGGEETVRSADALILGHIARIDRERSFSASPSNHLLQGVLRTDKAVSWSVDSRTSDANLLNRAGVVTAVRRGGGVWLWGNRLSNGDLIPKTRADDIITDELLDAVIDYVDRRVDLPFVEHIVGRLNTYIRTLVVAGHIRGGRAWFDPQYNNAATLAASQATFSFELTLHDIAEHIVIRSSVASLPSDIIDQLAA